MVDLRRYIRDVPNFPKRGIVFKDITPLLRNAEAFRAAIDSLARRARKWKPDIVAGIEARGFLFAAPLAQRLRTGVVPIRKPKKLPWKTVRKSYKLEYGSDSLEIHADAFRARQRVLLVDDLLATGGTMAACCGLVKRLKARVAGCLFVVELDFLEGRKKLGDHSAQSLLHYR